MHTLLSQGTDAAQFACWLLNYGNVVAVQVYDPSRFPSGTYEHIPDPTDQTNNGEPQRLYAPHWGGVRAFGYESNADMPDFLPEPLELEYKGNFSEVKAMGASPHLFSHLSIPPSGPRTLQ